MQEKFVELTSVPTLDPFVKHVNQADEGATKEGFRQKMWQNFEVELRKAHKGARVGLLSVALNQKILYNTVDLLQSWQTDSTLAENKVAEMKQLLMASFDASNRSLEQFARVGGLLHQVRRHVVLEDIQIPKKKR